MYVPPLSPLAPAPLPPWMKWGLRVLPAVWGAASALLDYSGEDQGETPLQWRRLAVEWQRATPAGTVDDHAFCTFDFVNITGGNVDTSWVTTDYTTIEAAADIYFDVVRGLQSSGHVLVFYKWYVMQFADPMLPNRRFLPTGPPVRITPRNKPGLTTGALPYQVALSVTERTAIAKHWGRHYLPGISESMTSGEEGRWAASVTSSIANACHAFFETCASAELFPVVVSTQAQVNAPPAPADLGGSLLGITHIQVDDIPDVIRRRRPRQAAVRSIQPPLA